MRYVVCAKCGSTRALMYAGEFAVATGTYIGRCSTCSGPVQVGRKYVVESAAYDLAALHTLAKVFDSIAKDGPNAADN